MILRGIAARRLLSFTIFLLMASVVAGTVVAVGFSRMTEVSQGSEGALVLLGLVAIAAAAAESVRRREHDLALARLRGRGGLRLLLFAVAEPSVVVICGALVGLGAGWVVARLAVEAWLPAGTTYRLGSDEWSAVGLVTLGSLLAVLVTSWRLTRRPLAQQLGGGRRPGAASTAALFLQVLLVLSAAVAVYQAHQDTRSRVDWFTLVSPALVGLAAGQILIWVLLAVLAVVVPRTRSAGLGWFVTLRRLLRRADSLAMVRVVVAAGVVLVVAASASSAAQSWRQESAKLQVGAPVSYPVAGGALEAFAVARQVDPQGRWLLPVAAYTDDGRPAARRVFVDTTRWKAVVGDFFSGTESAPLTGALDRMPPPPAAVFAHGDTVTVTVDTASWQRSVNIALLIQYVNDEGDLGVIHFPLRADQAQPAGPGLTRLTTRLPGCRLGCSMFELDIDGYTQGPLILHSIDFGGQQVLAPDAGLRPPGDRFLITVRRVGDGLSIAIPKFAYHQQNVVGTFRPTETQQAVVTPGLTFPTDGKQRTVEGVDGSPRPVRAVAEVPVLPFVGTGGAVLDLGRVLRGSSGSIPTTRARILARSDTPAGVVSALQSTGAVGPPGTYSEALGRLNQSPRAQGTRLYLLVAMFAALVALVSLATAVAQQRPERHQEAASMRSVGVSAREINGAYRREALLVALVSAVGTWAASWISCRVLLGALPLVSGWAFAPPLDASPRLFWVSGIALLAGAAVVAMMYVAFRRVGRAAAPRSLRQDIV